MTYLEKMTTLKEEAIAIRRHLHQNPEIGFDLPKTYEVVHSKLTEFGLIPEKIGDTNGITATIGPDNGKTLLLRADMDGLPIIEEAPLDFASKNDYGHLCGHDMHTTILLMTAKLLKENEDQLQGKIKFLFQPAEELLIGGAKMIEQGILENPRPDGAMALHMWPIGNELGYMITPGTALTSVLNFKITLRGKGTHGAMPFNGVDPVYAGAQIVIGVNEIIARELPSNKSASITIGKFDASHGSMNIIPDQIVLEGTARTLYSDSHNYLVQRLPEIISNIAKTYRTEAEVEILANCPALTNDLQMTESVSQSLRKIGGEKYPLQIVDPFLASEDFAYITSQVPSAYFFVSCPLPDGEGKTYPVHHPKVQFNEDALVIGAAGLTQAAIDWLEK